MTPRTGAGVAAVLIAAVVTAGCGATREGQAMPSRSPDPSASSPSDPARPPSSSAPSPSAASPSPSSSGRPLSSTDLPTLKPPAKPPKTPSDLVPTDRIAGRVTRGGSGPCYGVITDDGTEYAVYSAAGRTLQAGRYVRIRFEPLTLRIDCGPGRLIKALEITILG